MTLCVRCQAVIEDGDLRCAICGYLVAPAAPAPAVPHAPHAPLARHAPQARPTPQGCQAQVLRCGECGAAIAFCAEAGAPRCGFCGATMAIEQPIDPLESARLRIPFAVDRDAAHAALRGWLSRRGWLAPRTLSREAVLDAVAPLSWAAWLVNAEARVAWTADSDAGARRAAWAPHAGESTLELRDIVVPASRGLRPAEARLLVPYYDLQRAVPIDAPLAEGEATPAIERFDTQRSAARALVADRIDAMAKLRIEPEIPGNRFRNVHVACLIERQTTERIALPVWVLAYRYREKPYRVLVHGQRPEVVFGRAPVDWTKLGLIVAIASVIIALATWIVGVR